MNTAVINVKVNPTVKAKAQAVASDLGFSLSSLINAYLKQLIKTKTVTFSTAESEEPSEYLKKILKEAEADVRAGQVVSFKSPKDALNYVDSISNERPNRKKD